MTTVIFPSTLRPLTCGARKIEVGGSNLGEVFDALERQFPGIRERLCNRGELRRFFRIAVNSEITSGKSWSDLQISPADTVTIVTAVAGG